MMTVIEKQYMDAVIGINKHLRSREIDWEQRRYEIDTTAMQGYCFAIGIETDAEVYKSVAEGAVCMADALIAELKATDETK